MGDTFEPGQDDLIRDDSAGKGIFKRAKNISLSTVSKDEALYTDHNAGDPASMVPMAEKNQKGDGPVGGSVFEGLRNSISGAFRTLRDLLSSKTSKKS